MKFKNKNTSAVSVLLSGKEAQKYPWFGEEIEIVEGGLNRTVADGRYDLEVHGVPVELKVKITEEGLGNRKASFDANGFVFEIFKPRDIRKYDLYRVIVQNWKDISGK